MNTKNEQGNGHKVAGTQTVINGQNAKVKVIAKSPLGRSHNFTYYYLTMEDAKKGVKDREKMYVGTSGFKYEYYERQGRKWCLIEQ